MRIQHGKWQNNGATNDYVQFALFMEQAKQISVYINKSIP